MLILSILTGLLISGLLISKYVNADYNIWGDLLAIFSGVVLFITVVSIPLKRMDYSSQIPRYMAFKQALENSRLSEMSELERATITIEISKWNQDIAQVKYYNEIFDLWIPDEVTELEPIK